MNAVTVNDTTFSYRIKPCVTKLTENTTQHFQIFDHLMALLFQNGFVIMGDPDIDKDFPILSKDHRYGKKGSLEFKAERYTKGFCITFYQNVNFKSEHGGYYDFNKRNKMPYLIRKEFENIINKLLLATVNEQCENETKPQYTLAEDRLKAIIVEDRDYPQTDMNFSLSDLNGTVRPNTYDFNRADRNQKLISNGDVRYFRDTNGYLYRGRCYQGLNNMWWVITDKYTLRNIAAFDLFELTDNDEKRRVVPHNPPKDFIKKREILNAAKTSELIAELRIRGFKVKLK